MFFFRKLFDYFVYSNLFIAACAVLMAYQTGDLLLHTSPDLYLIAFIFFATICSYSFHWYLTPDVSIESPRLRWLKKNRGVHTVLFFVGLTGSVVFGFFLVYHWYWLLLSALITFLYSAPKIPHPYFRALRKVAFGKTLFLAFVWMYVTTIFPIQVSDEPWRPDFFLFAAGRFFLIYAICIIFDYRDREYDRSIGIRSLITWLNEKSITILFAVSLVAFAIFTCLLYNYGYQFDMIFILLTPGFIAAVMYNHLTKNFSDILYYFIVDGLMALSAFIMLLLNI